MPIGDVCFVIAVKLTDIFDLQACDFQTTLAVRSKTVLVPSRGQLFTTFVQRHVQCSARAVQGQRTGTCLLEVATSRRTSHYDTHLGCCVHGVQKRLCL